MYFEEDSKLVKHAHLNLSDTDWEVLEGLEEVLKVSWLFYPVLPLALITGTGSSPFSAANVI
jgi:hypothetical protein